MRRVPVTFPVRTISILILAPATPVPALLVAQQVDTSVTKAALFAADSALGAAVQRKGAVPFLDALEPDAAVLFTGQPILRGADEARNPFAARYAAPSSYSWRAVHAVASADGDFGCTLGFSHFWNGADTVRLERRGTYITCWRRNSDGRWRIAGHQRSDSPATAPQADDSALIQGPHSATVSLPGDPRTEAQNADARFALMAAEAAGPGPAFAKFAAEDAMLLTPAELPRGPKQIRELFQGYPLDRVLLWEPMRRLGAGSGGLAFTVGHTIDKSRDGRAGKETHGKFLTVWRQQVDGTWAYVLDLGSPRP